MTIYRCYFLDPQNHIIDVEPIDQPDDELACGQAGDRLASSECHAVEVWEAGRLVRRLGTPLPASLEDAARYGAAETDGSTTYFG